MYDKELACHILGQVLQSSKTIMVRFKPVRTVADFIGTPAGMEKFDSICMLLISIGEGVISKDFYSSLIKARDAGAIGYLRQQNDMVSVCLIILLLQITSIFLLWISARRSFQKVCSL